MGTTTASEWPLWAVPTDVTMRAIDLAEQGVGEPTSAADVLKIARLARQFVETLYGIKGRAR